MTPILVDKFEQNDHLLDWLRSTGTRKLVEAAGPHDKVWGNGLRLSDSRVSIRSARTGTNLQGKILETVRRILYPELYGHQSMDTENTSSEDIPSTQIA